MNPTIEIVSTNEVLHPNVFVSGPRIVRQQTVKITVGSVVRFERHDFWAQGGNIVRVTTTPIN